MIDDLIQLGQYKEALQYLTDLDDENIRYQRLVCLYGLKEYQRAREEGMKAKVLAQSTYYDVTAIYISILKELEEFDEAINIIVEELSMPYIPYQYETVFNTAYDELLLAKKEAFDQGVTQSVFNEEDIENILDQDHNEELLYMAIEQLESMNVRRLLPSIRRFLRNNEKPDFAKSLLIEVMIDQDVDEDMVVVKNGIEYDIHPSFEPMVLLQESREAIVRLLSDVIEDDNPSLYLLCEQFLDFYLYCIYPKYIDEYDYRNIAGAIHYHLASMQYIDIEIEEIEMDYDVDKEDIYETLKSIQGIEF